MAKDKAPYSASKPMENSSMVEGCRIVIRHILAFSLVKSFLAYLAVKILGRSIDKALLAILGC